MKTYEYKGYDTGGRVAKGLVEALSVKGAREQLAAEGVLVERLTLSGQALRFAAESRAVVYRELSALLAAGLTLVRSLDILIRSPQTQVPGTLLAGVRDRVREGVGLASALADASGAVTVFERAVIDSGERSANLATVLKQLAVFLEEQERVKERIRSALVYPLIVVTVGICVGVIMLGLLVPRARDMMDGSGAELPALTGVVIALCQFLFHWGPLLLLAGGVAVVGLRRRMRRDESLRLRWNQWCFRLPLIGKSLDLLVSIRFARTLSILLHGGVPLVEAVSLSGKATGSLWVASMAERESDAIRHGDKLSAAIKRMAPLAGALAEWTQIGEESGALGDLLDHAADRCSESWDRVIGRALTVMEPVLLLIVGAFVLLVTISVLLPIMSLTQSITP
ncbi:MAG: type II secretion system F family protein [Verrucomicrobia bacterium]|nr:type II secretion system F family protein [Verrucomicrobiota bacterium]